MFELTSMMNTVLPLPEKTYRSSTKKLAVLGRERGIEVMRHRNTSFLWAMRQVIKRATPTDFVPTGQYRVRFSKRRDLLPASGSKSF